MDSYLEKYMDWLDAEYQQWDAGSEAQRVYRVMCEIDRLQLKLRTATPDERAHIQDCIAGLNASIADFGF